MNKFLSNDCWLDAHRGCAEPQDIGHILKNFDLTSKFGPCLGLTRLERRVRLPCCMRGSAMLRAEFAVTQLLNTVHSIHPRCSHADICSRGAALLKEENSAGLRILSLFCRWNRAQQLGLNPPAEVHRILESLPDEDSMHESIWAGRV